MERDIMIEKYNTLNHALYNHKRTLFCCLCYGLAVVFYSFDPLMQAFPSVITGQLMQTFSLGAIGVGVVASSYFYTYNFLQIPMGILGDIIGEKKVIIFCSILCFLGLVLFSKSNSVFMLIFSRLLMGAGASSAAALLILISSKYFPIATLPILVGFAQLAANFGSILGQAPLSLLVTATSWRYAILFLSAICGVIFLASVFILDSNKPPVNDAGVKIKYFQVLVNVIKAPHNIVIALYAFFLWAPFYSFASLWGIPYFFEKYAMSTSSSAFMMSLAWIGSGVGSLLFGFLSSYIKHKKRMFLVISPLIGVVTFPLLLTSVHVHQSIIGALLFIFGVSSAGQALSFAVITENNAKEIRGLLAGFLNTVIMMGPMIFDPTMGCLIRYFWQGNYLNSIPHYSVDNYDKAFFLIPASLLLSMFFGFLIKIKPASSA